MAINIFSSKTRGNSKTLQLNRFLLKKEKPEMLNPWLSIN